MTKLKCLFNKNSLNTSTILSSVVSVFCFQGHSNSCFFAKKISFCIKDIFKKSTLKLNVVLPLDTQSLDIISSKDYMLCCVSPLNIEMAGRCF